MGKIETTVVEKIVEVPHQLVQEVALEVPQVCVAEVVTQTAQPQQQRIVQTGRAHKRGKQREEVVNSVHGGVMVGEYYAQAVGVREMLGPKTEASSVVQVQGDDAVYAAPVVASAAPPPEIVSGPIRLAEAPPVTHVSAPPPVFEQLEPMPQEPTMMTSGAVYTAPPIMESYSMEPMMTPMEPVTGGTMTMGGTITMAGPPVGSVMMGAPQVMYTGAPGSSVMMSAPQVSSVTMAAPPVMYAGAPVMTYGTPSIRLP